MSEPEIWTKSEKKFVKENADKIKDKTLLTTINKIRLLSGRPVTTLGRLRSLRKRLGIQKGHGHPCNGAL